MIFPIKNESDMLQEMMDEVVSRTNIKNMTPGSIARTLLEVINRKLATCYKDIDLYTSMCFLSTAKDSYLDMIGALLDCSRLSNETDNNYRYRISKQIYTAAGGNLASIRLECLAVPGVKNVVITPYTRGNGSFTVHVITNEINTSSEILQQVNLVVQRSKSEGINAIVAKPTPVPINIKFNVIPKTGTRVNEISIASQIKVAVSSYIDSIPMGGTVSIYEILKIAQNNPSIAQAYIGYMTINGDPAIVETEYKLGWDERAYIDNILVTV